MWCTSCFPSDRALARTLSLDMDAVAAPTTASPACCSSAAQISTGPHMRWAGGMSTLDVRRARPRRVTTLRSNVPSAVPVEGHAPAPRPDVCEHTWHRGVGVAETDTKHRHPAARPSKTIMGFCLLRHYEARPKTLAREQKSARGSNSNLASQQTTRVKGLLLAAPRTKCCSKRPAQSATAARNWCNG